MRSKSFLKVTNTKMLLLYSRKSRSIQTKLIKTKIGQTDMNEPKIRTEFIMNYVHNVKTTKDKS